MKTQTKRTSQLFTNGLLAVGLFTLFLGCQTDNQPVPESKLYAMHEITILSSVAGSFEEFPVVHFQKPDRGVVEVDGFFDGDSTYKVRAYCDTPGMWKWEITSKGDFKPAWGSFRVVESDLKGKLRKHPEDPYQFAYDNGEWYLHIGDTGYRYLSANEPKWKEYIDQAVEVGMTKIRTWFNSSRFGVEELFNEDHSALNLPYWQEIDKRIAYAYENYPGVNLQLIPFGEDTEELKRYYGGDSISYDMVRYAQARFSAYPNIQWCISNDREIVKDTVEMTGRQITEQIIEKIAKDMAEREPWGTLLTNHQSRYRGYDFVEASWSDIITLEDVDQVDGRLIAEYRAKGSDPVVLDEDRYELYIKPDDPRYYFRRMMWASLLSGGHATYGGIHTYISHDEEDPDRVPDDNMHLLGVQGYFDVGMTGADDFKYITSFFEDSELTLVDMEPDDALVGDDHARGRQVPQRFKCIHNDSIYIVYLANPDQIADISPHQKKYELIRTARADDAVPMVSILLPDGEFSYKWYNPRTGEWEISGAINGGETKLEAPGIGDWVLLLKKN